MGKTDSNYLEIRLLNIPSDVREKYMRNTEKIIGLVWENLIPITSKLDSRIYQIVPGCAGAEVSETKRWL